MGQVSTPLTELWFHCFRQRAQPRWRLFCFPYSGGGTAIYRTWATHLPDAIEVWAAQLPGREKRLRETAFTDVPKLLAALGEALTPLLDRPVAFFGHSMGAWLCFELARFLRSVQAPQPQALFLSAQRAPSIPLRRAPIAQLPEPEFLNALRRFNGTPAELLEHAEFMQIMLPMLRADFALYESYTYHPEPPLTCPFTVFGGLQDFDVPREDLTPWRELTTAATTFRMVPGDHFFIKTAPGVVTQAVAQDLLRLGK